MIKELTHGEYDAASAPSSSRGASRRRSTPAGGGARAGRCAGDGRGRVAEAQPELPVVVALAAVAAPSIPPEITPSGPAPAALSRPPCRRVGGRRAGAVRGRRAARGGPAPRPGPKPVVVVKPAALKRPPVVLSSSADGVVVRRNVVINVGAGAPTVNGTAIPSPQPEPARAHSGRARRRCGRGRLRERRPLAVPGSHEARGPAAAAGLHARLRMPWETGGAASSAPPVVAAAVPEPRRAAPVRSDALGSASPGPARGLVRRRARQRQEPRRGHPRVPVRRRRARGESLTSGP